MKAPLAFALVAAALFGGVIYFEENRISALEWQIETHRKNAADLLGKISRLKADNEDLERRLKDNKSLTEQLQSKLAKGPAASPESTSSTSPQAPVAESSESGGANMMKNLAKMFSDPEMRKSMRSQQMMGIRMMYGDLAKELGLTPQEGEQLLELLTDRQMDMAAASMKAFDPNNPDKADQDRLAESSQRYEDQIKAMLGDEKFKTLKSYESSMGDRFMLQQFESQFNTAGAPLEGDQKQQLLALMRDERQNTPPNLNLANSNPGKQMEALKNPEMLDQFVANQDQFQKRVLDRSRKFLNADQIGALEKVHQQQLEMLKMQLKMSRQMMGLEK